MIDFSASWCAPCHELDRYTLTDDRVRAMARTFLAYKADLTRYDSPEAEALRRQYGINGVPTVVFIGPDGREVIEARVEGFIPPEAFLDRMHYVAQKTGADQR
jgi:thiol:disulfide interchange protein DsbD